MQIVKGLIIFARNNPVRVIAAAMIVASIVYAVT